MSPADRRPHAGSGRTPTSLLAVDVGNQLTKAARFSGGQPAAETAFPTAEGLAAEALPDRLASLGDCDAAAVCSVVPQATEAWTEFSRTHLGLEPLLIRGDTPTPLANRYRTPETLGPDRLAAAVAAHAVAGAPVIAVMLGTAITVDVVSAAGEYLGGAIAPGVHAGLKGLAAKAAQLTEVEVARPERAIGRDTDQAMRAGLAFGAIGQVRELVARVRRELGADAPVVLTGGDADLVADELEGVHTVDRALVLRGVHLIWRHNAV